MDDDALLGVVHEALARAHRASLRSPELLSAFSRVYFVLRDAVDAHRCFVELLRAGRNAEVLFTAQLVRGDWT
jgi:hypothetical protein